MMALFSASYLIELKGHLSGKLTQYRVILRGLFLGFADFSHHPRPKRMIQGERGIDDKFCDKHNLYHRCKKEDLDGDRMNPSRIRCENTSVNWSKYSKPWDVIFDYPGYGVVRFLVRNLPTELPTERPPDAKLRSFVPVHDPKPTNYVHAEIATFTDGARVPKPSLGRMVKKEFQNLMSDRSLVILRPNL